MNIYNQEWDIYMNKQILKCPEHSFIYNSSQYFLAAKVSDKTEMMQTKTTKVLVTLFMNVYKRYWYTCSDKQMSWTFIYNSYQ